MQEDQSSNGLAGAFLGVETERRGELRVFDQPEEEIRGALRRVKRLLQSGVRPKDIALVVMDDDAWAAQVSAVAWEYGDRCGSQSPGHWHRRGWAAGSSVH